MGRPKQYKQRVGVMVYLDAAEYEALENIRWRDRKDMTEIMRLAALDYIRAHTNGNDSFKLDEWQQEEEKDFHAVPTLWADKEKWKSYLRDCTEQELDKIAASVGYIKKETHFARYGKYSI